jgi:GT2 family glycosyltransferase
MHRPVVSVVLGTYNRFPFLKAALRSVRREVSDIPHEIIVVDGGSSDGTLGWLQKQKDVIVIVQHNHGVWLGAPVAKRSWGYFMNLGFRCAQGRFILMISDDCLLVHGSLKNGITRFDSMSASGHKVGAVAFYWRNWPEQTDYWIGLTLGGKMFVNHGLYLRDALAQVGWIEEDLYQFYHADGDLCLRLWQAGWEVADCPDAFVEHYEHTSHKTRWTSRSVQQADWEAFLERWSGVFYDPTVQNVGDWLHRQFHDEWNTVREFPKVRGLATLIMLRVRSRLLCEARKRPRILRFLRNSTRLLHREKRAA